MAGVFSDDFTLPTILCQRCQIHTFRGSEAMQTLWSSTSLPSCPQR